MRLRMIAVSLELDELRQALRGIRLLSDLACNDAAPNKQAARIIPEAISATLNVITARLKQVSSALRGDLDPGVLVADHNVVEGTKHQDVYLEERSGRERGSRR